VDGVPENNAETKAPGGQVTPKPAQLLDPARPLRMPGASLREPERGVVVGALFELASAIAAEFRRRREAKAAGGATPGADATALKAPKRPWPVSFVLAVGLLGVFAVVMIAVVPFQYEPAPDPPPVTETTQAAASVPVVPAAVADAGLAAVDAAPPPPKVFRVKSMSEDPAIEIVEGTVGKRTLIAALAGSGLSMRDAYRALHAFKGVKAFDRPQATDSFVLAKQRSGGRLVGFEYVVPPFDVWQARELEEGRLEGKKVEFVPEPRRVARAVVIGDDLRKSLVQAELDDDLLTMLDDALDGHAELVDMRPGARLRIVAEEERIEGAFARYSHVDAVEYFPANAKAKPVRVYRFDPEAAAAGTKKRAHLFYDDHGRQPFKGGFRTPLPLGRITSRFNPRRMHPVLHVLMPHNGVDYAAPIGTPIYATAPGIVRVAAMSGPNGNMVQVQHPNGLTSAYCHLSRFAAGLHGGQHVESRQLVGYVGTTGRSTGPHLHFAIKRGEVFLDPLGLRLDGMRTLPPSDKEAFDKLRAELDAAIDAIALPAAPVTADGVPSSAAEPEDVIYDEVPDAGP
jgi:murein DD-endopeptidase MepM/ murein hydrolase activator NlpD